MRPESSSPATRRNLTPVSIRDIFLAYISRISKLLLFGQCTNVVETSKDVNL